MWQAEQSFFTRLYLHKQSLPWKCRQQLQIYGCTFLGFLGWCNTRRAKLWCFASLSSSQSKYNNACYVSLSLSKNLWTVKVVADSGLSTLAKIAVKQPAKTTSNCPIWESKCKSCFGYLGRNDTNRTDPNLCHITQGSQGKYKKYKPCCCRKHCCKNLSM